MPATDNMPTAARGITALLMGGLAWIASDMIRPLMPEATAFGIFNYVNVALGLICGWRVTGRRLGYGWGTGISAGLSGVAALVFWAVAAQSLNKMLDMALDRRLKGVMDALNTMFEIAAQYGLILFDGPLIGFLVAGGVGIGVIGEWVSRRWS